MTESMRLTPEIISDWAQDKGRQDKGPLVALHLKQRLLPVEGKDGVIFPPTYADIGYNIDALHDGTKVATIDSVGSQANRIEPIFKYSPYADLVPQIKIELYSKEEDGVTHVENRSLFDLAHRSADAVVYSTPQLFPEIEKAFRALKRRGDAAPLCRLAPTSLIFGVWDSRGGSGEKRPRLLRSIIRAWKVQPLHAAAQFNSVWKNLDADQQAQLEQEAKAKRAKLSEKGLADAPAIFRKMRPAAAQAVPEFRDGAANSNRRNLGGVVVEDGGRIEREITINLAALRKIAGATDTETQAVRRYLLSLTLLAATSEIDMYLREGCHLRFDGDDKWNGVPRRGTEIPIDLVSEGAQQVILEYAKKAADLFREGWPKHLIYKFDIDEAKRLLAKKTDEEDSNE